MLWPPPELVPAAASAGCRLACLPDCLPRCCGQLLPVSCLQLMLEGCRCGLCSSRLVLLKVQMRFLAWLRKVPPRCLVAVLQQAACSGADTGPMSQRVMCAWWASCRCVPNDALLLTAPLPLHRLAAGPMTALQADDGTASPGRGQDAIALLSAHQFGSIWTMTHSSRIAAASCYAQKTAAAPLTWASASARLEIC